MTREEFQKIREYQNRREQAPRLYVIELLDAGCYHYQAGFMFEQHRDRYFDALKASELHAPPGERRRFIKHDYPIDCERVEDLES